MLPRLTIKETVFVWAFWITSVIVIFCTWAVIVLISWTLYLMWKMVL